MTSTTTSRLEGLTTSVAVKAPCRVVATSNITLEELQSIDGVTVVANDRVLLTAQTDGTENGIWNASTGDWTRAKDFNGSLDVVGGTLIYVSAGDTRDGTWWVVGGSGALTPGTDSLSITLALPDQTSTVVTVADTTDTLSDADHGKTIYYTAATAVTVTVPTGLRTDFVCSIVQGGAGQVTVSDGVGVTLNHADGLYATQAQYVRLTLWARAEDAYVLEGRTA